LRAGKDQETGQLGRPIYEEEESHAGVSFQQANEHYTPWKGVEAADEKEESLEERPTTWAEALRKKQNLANGVSEKNHSFKGQSSIRVFLGIFSSSLQGLSSPSWLPKLQEASFLHGKFRRMLHRSLQKKFLVYCVLS